MISRLLGATVRFVLIIFGIITDKIGAKRTIIITLVLWLITIILSFFLNGKTDFYIIGFSVGILTKSRLVSRDFDILTGHSDCSLGCTLTTMDEHLRFRLEPGASPTWERITILEEAASKGIRITAFLGPFMPYLSDTNEALASLIGAVAHLPLDRVYADKLNPRPGVWNSVAIFLNRYYPHLLDGYQKLFFDREYYLAYCSDLRTRIRTIAKDCCLKDSLMAVF